MQNAIVNINGQILGPKDASVSVFDRGYLYGDSLYEVARSYQGRFFLLEAHLHRLRNSAQRSLIELEPSEQYYEGEIYKTFNAFREQPGCQHLDAYMRIIISRGIGRIGFGKNCVETPSQMTIIVQPVEPPTEEHFKKGLKLKVAKRIRNDRRALDPAVKSGNYLNSLLAYLECTNATFSDALLCNAEGHLTEGTTFNIFYIRRGILATPPLDIGILEGITRQKVLQIADSLGIPSREVRFPRERLYEADEVFLTSSIKEVMPIVQIDNKKIGRGLPGPLTQRIHEQYRKLIQKTQETKVGT